MGQHRGPPVAAALEEERADVRLHLLQELHEVPEPEEHDIAPAGADEVGRDEVGGDEIGVRGEGVRDRRTRIAVLVGLTAVLAAAGLDSTVTSVALPTIRDELGGGAQAIQWVASVYFLAASLVVVPSGRMVDVVGARKVLVAGCAVYIVGSVVAIGAPDTWVLVAGRALQGAGSGIVAPSAVVLLTETFGDRRRGWALGLIGSLLAVSSAVGPLVGGALTDTIGWRVIFVNHLVLTLVGVALVMRGPRVAPRVAMQATLDLGGIVLWAGVILSFQLALLHWSDVAPGLGPALLVATVGFGVLLVRAERGQEAPMLDLRLLRVPEVAAAALARIGVAFAFFGTLYYLTLYLQSDDGYSAFATGLVLLPSSLVGVAASPLVGRVIDRTGSGQVLWLGTAASAMSLFLIALFNEADASALHLAPGLAVNGLGYAMVQVSAKSAPLEAVAPELRGRATSLVSVLAKAAAGFGVTVATGFFNLYTPAGSSNATGDFELDDAPHTQDFIARHLGASDLRHSFSHSDALGAGFSGVDQAAEVVKDCFAFVLSLMSGSLAVIVLLAAGGVALLVRRSTVGGPPVEG